MIKKFLEIGSGDATKLHATKLYALKWVKMVTFMLCIFTTIKRGNRHMLKSEFYTASM